MVATQSKLASGKAVRESIEAIATEYTNGYSFSHIQRSFDQILTTAGTCTGDPASTAALAAIKETLGKNNAIVAQKQRELNQSLKACAGELLKAGAELEAQPTAPDQRNRAQGCGPEGEGNCNGHPWAGADAPTEQLSLGRSPRWSSAPMNENRPRSNGFSCGPS